MLRLASVCSAAARGEHIVAESEPIVSPALPIVDEE
jgi:hypothetical protein